MAENRPHIPAELIRRVETEAGHRCAIQTCRQTPIEIAHIVPWATVKIHEFSNLIALCPNCHTRFDKKEIDRKSMLMYKAQLSPGRDIAEEISQRLERVEALSQSPPYRPQGFANAVYLYQNRTCPIGILDGRRFLTAGICTFVQPRTAIVPGAVIDMIDGLLKVRGDSAAVWEPMGMSKFQTIEAPKKDGDLRLIRVDIPSGSAFESLKNTLSDEQLEEIRPQFVTNESTLQTDLRIGVGEHLGFLSLPEETQELRGPMEFQFQDTHVSFRGSMETGGVHTGYLTPIGSSVTRSGGPLFRSDGTLVGLVTGILALDGETGRRPVYTSLWSLPQLWRHLFKSATP